MKQTAVEWMANEFLYLDNDFDMKLIDKNEYQARRKQVIKQAKEMEKEQMDNFFKNGIEYGFDSYHANELAEEPTRPNFEQYYNETFKSE
jgi:hypothetical protein